MASEGGARTTSSTEPSPEEREATQRQLGRLQAHAAGYFAIWTLDLGHRFGLFRTLADQEGGVSAPELAAKHGLDPEYVRVWCRAGFALEILDMDGGRYRLAPGLTAPLLQPDSPVYFAGTVAYLTALREQFTFLRTHMTDGGHAWWDTFPEETAEGVSDSSRTFYTRLLRRGFRQVPGLEAKLQGPLTFVELACGRGRGLVRLARAYPKVRFIGVDGDARSLARARDLVAAEGLSDRIQLQEATLETGPLPPADVVLMNIALHEARDRRAVLAHIKGALRPGGLLLASEFPFPGTPEGLRQPAGAMMSGIQFMEAILGDQLMTVPELRTLLEEAGFAGIGHADLAPIHVLAWGTPPPGP